MLLLAPAAVVLAWAAPFVRCQHPPQRADRPATTPAMRTPHWIWKGPARKGAVVCFRRRFDLAAAPRSAVLHATCDNRLTLWINGHRVFEHDHWENPRQLDVARHLRAGTNVVAVRGENREGPAALALRLAVEDAPDVVTDGSWRAHPGPAPRGWNTSDFDDRSWSVVDDLGVVGRAGLPWSAVGPDAFGLPVHDRPQRARTAAEVQVPAGFVAELLYEVPRAQGSWVCLATGPDGSLYTSDQRRGLYRVWPARAGDAESTTRVERVPVRIGGAQGLLWAFDSLYAVVNGSRSGLYRLRDRDGDGRLDHAELLRRLHGSGEHGPHAVVLGPHGRSLFVVCGNHTDPTEFAVSRVPRPWREDLLLPRQWDAKGHARGRKAPGGWIARVDPDGRLWELWSAGYRNPYDLAFGPEGEAFTYDADMEWDMGMPWYRPTRICHVTSGSEYGWRAGSGKFPPDYPDTLPPVLDIGPGSPTGVLFAARAAFPTRYRRAMLALDWTFGIIWAIHLAPRGASFTARREAFVTGKPLPLTDAVVGEDGALYFTVGGRGLRSALYRLRYPGAISSAPHVEDASWTAGRELRDLRRRLERWHGRVDPRALDEAWPQLDHPDRFVRYAARVAVESQPVDSWRGRALAERRPRARRQALLALARCSDRRLHAPLLHALESLAWDRLQGDALVEALRTLAVACIRTGRPDPDQAGRLAQRLESRLPSGHARADAELTRVLVYLGSAAVVAKAMDLIERSGPPQPPDWAGFITRNDSYGAPIAKMLADPPPLRALHHAFVLRHARRGWTLDLRRRYFRFLNAAARHPGGASYEGFLRHMRKEALATCSDEERRELAELAGEPPSRPPPEPVTPRGPGRAWTVAEAVRTLGKRMKKRDYERGRGLFFGIGCAGCHRFDGEGGAIGPDLTGLGYRFTLRDALEAVIEPGKVISDLYGSRVVKLRDGSELFGIVVEHRDRVEVHGPEPGAPPRVVPRDEIERIEDSPVSQMPAGLVNTLSADEFADLMAFLMSGGDPGGRAFRK